MAAKTVSNLDRPVQILLAEDSDINQKIARLMLEKQGFHVTVAADGRQAVMACEQQRYDLILMDISMPVMDGYAAARSIREGKSQAQWAPIIAMTGHAVESIRDRCRDHGMDDCIGKPLQRDQLLSMVKKWAAGQPNSAPFEASRKLPGPMPHPATAAPLDLSRAIKEFMGHTDVLFELLDSFVDKTWQQIDTIDQAVASDDCKTVAAQAHSLKGAAANLTADQLAQTAGQLEKSAERGAPALDADLVAKLRGQLEALQRFVRQNHCPSPDEEQNEDFDC